jgi:hypothetical protein
MMKILAMQPPMSLLNVSYASVQNADAAGWDENCEEVHPRYVFLLHSPQLLSAPRPSKQENYVLVPRVFRK